MRVRVSRGVVDLWLGNVDVMDRGASSTTTVSTTTTTTIASTTVAAAISTVASTASTSTAARAATTSTSTSTSAVGFWNLDQLGRCLHSETLLGSHFLASRCGDVKALLLVLFRADSSVRVEANVLRLSFAESVGECAKAASSVPTAWDVEAYVLSLRSAALSLVDGQALPSRNLPAVVDRLAFTLFHGNHFRHLDAPRVWLHRTLLAVDGVTLGARGSSIAGRLRHKVANLLVSTVPVCHKLALLHLVHVAVAGAVTLEAHLVLNHTALWLLEVDALLLDLYADGRLAHADRLWDAFDLANIGAHLFTLGRAASLSLH